MGRPLSAPSDTSTMSSDLKFRLQAAAVLAVAAAYLPFFGSLLRAPAENPYGGHVVFVPIFAGLLLWRDRHRYRELAGRGHPGGVAVAGLALAVLAMGYQSGVLALQAVSFPVALAGLGLWVYGPRGLRQAAFVLLFLPLMAPLPQTAVSAISPTVQHAVATFSATLLRLIWFPVEQRGILLYVPGLTLEVAEECNGLRFLPILVVFVSAFARIVLPTASSQAVLIALSIPAAMLANGLRVVATAIGTHVIGPEIASGPTHYYIGKAFWILALLTMIAIAWQLRSRLQGRLDRGPSTAYVGESQ